MLRFLVISFVDYRSFIDSLIVFSSNFKVPFYSIVLDLNKKQNFAQDNP